MNEEKTMRALLLGGTAAIALGVISTAVWAASDQANQNSQAHHQNLRANLTQMLQQSGYTDIRVAPRSFVVRAKDRDGNPVVMSISPDQFAEVTAVGDTTGSTSKSGNDTTGSTENAGNTGDSHDMFVTVPEHDDLSSKVVGLDIYNSDNKDIGTIKDIALNPNGRASAYIVSVGGFLGVGDRYVAIKPSAVNVTYNDGDKKWHATMNTTADQLKSAPEFKYTGKWNASRT
jgi:sporulation protein YlmC with PRC-barrel domain